jgi:hypothetical protein
MSKAFIIACMEYFGKRSGQTTLEFKNEVEALTRKDKEELQPLLAAALGCEVTLPPVA